MEVVKMNKLISSISKVTGIKESVLHAQVELKGVLSLTRDFDNLRSQVTRIQFDKLKAIQSIVYELNCLSVFNEDIIVDSSTKGINLFIDRLKDILDKEFFEVAFLNSQNKVICIEKLFEGTIGECALYVRDIIKKTLEHNATSIIIAHNHPGGSLKPSQADLLATKKIGVALSNINVKLLDAIIIGSNMGMSFAEKGYCLEG